MSKKNFVASSNSFETIKEAEEKVTGWMKAGQLQQKMRLYKVVKVYKPVIKFKETNE